MCDSLICPEDAESCRITMKSLQPDFAQLLKTTACLSTAGEVLKTKDNLIDNPNKGQYYTHEETKSVEHKPRSSSKLGDFFIP